MIYISITNWKKYAQELEHKLCLYLEHMSMSRMSKPNYYLDDMKSVSDDAQAELHYSIVKDDINDILNSGGTLQDVMDYVNDLV